MSLADVELVVSYSDGEGGDAGVGVAVWSRERPRPLAAFAVVPDVVRKLWGRVAGRAPPYNDIFLIEAVGPLLVLYTFPNVVKNKLWIHFIDNTAAQSALIRGSSSVASGDQVVGLTWHRIQRLSTRPFFERVESKANPVDGLSRGRREGPWSEVHPANFPVHELLPLAIECGDADYDVHP